MKILVIGYGSMGKRRIRILRELIPDVEIICVDKNHERIRQAKENNITVYQDLEYALRRKPDAAFVCTSPGNHGEIITKLVSAEINVFTELNLTDKDYDKIISLSKERNVIVFMSSTMLYNKQVQIIDEYVKKQNKSLAYIYHVGQYLPDWHPWESYKDFFVGKRETNGVREIFAIQLPWIINTFGPIESLSVNRQNCTDLEIDFPDTVIVNFKHKNGNIGVFAADTVSRKAAARLEVIGEGLHIFWNGHNDDLFVYDIDTKKSKQIYAYENAEHIEGYSDNIIENQYKDEIKEFLETVSLGKIPRYSLEKDSYTLSIINEIEGNGK